MAFIPKDPIVQQCERRAVTAIEGAPDSAIADVYRALAREIMAATTGRNVGYVKETDTYFLQYGVNFLNQPCTTLLIGGTIYHKCKEGGQFGRDLRLIAAGTQYNEAESWILRPEGRVLLDAAYMVSTVGGLYGYIDPRRALRMMKRNLLPLE